MNRSGRWMYNARNIEIWDGEDYKTDVEAVQAAFNDENFIKENAIRGERDYLLPVNIGKISQSTICMDLDIATEVIEFIQSAHNDVYGEYAETYLEDASAEQRKGLNEILIKTIEDWADKHGFQPMHFLIKNQTEETFTIENGNALTWAKEKDVLL